MGFTVSFSGNGFSWTTVKSTIGGITVTYHKGSGEESSVYLTGINIRLGSGNGSVHNSAGGTSTGNGGTISASLSTGSITSSSAITKSVDVESFDNPSGVPDYTGYFYDISNNADYNVLFSFNKLLFKDGESKTFTLTVSPTAGQIASARNFGTGSITAVEIPSTPAKPSVIVDPGNICLIGNTITLTGSTTSTGTVYYKYWKQESDDGTTWGKYPWESFGSTISSSTGYTYTGYTTTTATHPYIRFQCHVSYVADMQEGNLSRSDISAAVHLKLNPPKEITWTIDNISTDRTILSIGETLKFTVSGDPSYPNPAGTSYKIMHWDGKTIDSNTAFPVSWEYTPSTEDAGYMDDSPYTPFSRLGKLIVRGVSHCGNYIDSDIYKTEGNDFTINWTPVTTESFNNSVKVKDRDGNFLVDGEILYPDDQGNVKISWNSFPLEQGRGNFNYYHVYIGLNNGSEETKIAEGINNPASPSGDILVNLRLNDPLYEGSTPETVYYIKLVPYYGNQDNGDITNVRNNNDKSGTKGYTTRSPSEIKFTFKLLLPSIPKFVYPSLVNPEESYNCALTLNNRPRLIFRCPEIKGSIYPITEVNLEVDHITNNGIIASESHYNATIYYNDEGVPYFDSDHTDTGYIKVLKDPTIDPQISGNAIVIVFKLDSIKEYNEVDNTGATNHTYQYHVKCINSQGFESDIGSSSQLIKSRLASSSEGEIVTANKFALLSSYVHRILGGYSFVSDIVKSPLQYAESDFKDLLIHKDIVHQDINKRTLIKQEVDQPITLTGLYNLLRRFYHKNTSDTFICIEEYGSIAPFTDFINLTDLEISNYNDAGTFIQANSLPYDPDTVDKPQELTIDQREAYYPGNLYNVILDILKYVY